MPMRWKKFAGMILLLVFLAFWALFTVAVAIKVLPDANWFVELLFYAVMGIVWIFPVRYLMVWMNTPGPGDEPA